MSAGQRDSNVIERECVASRAKLDPPRHYAVVIYNDDYTPFDFVNMLLIAVFRHTHESAHAISTAVHKTGRGVAGTFTLEIAETRCQQAQSLISQTEFPLQLELEQI